MTTKPITLSPARKLGDAILKRLNESGSIQYRPGHEYGYITDRGEEILKQMLEAALPAQTEAVVYRVGTKVPRTVYEGDVPLFVAATPELAARIVRVLNKGAFDWQETLASPRDGGVREALTSDDVRHFAPELWQQFDKAIAEGIAYWMQEDGYEGLTSPSDISQGIASECLASVLTHCAALSAPGSAGPGAPQIEAKERARKRIQALGAALSRRDWSETERAYEAIRDAHDRPDIYDAPLRATPATTAETPKD